MSQRPKWLKLIPVSFSMKHAKEYCYSPLDWMLVYRRVTPQQFVGGTHFIHVGAEEKQSGEKFLV